MSIVLVFFSPFSIAITSLGEERANLSAFRMFVRFVLVWICRFLLPLGVWEGLRFVIVALPELFSYFFWHLLCARWGCLLLADTCSSSFFFQTFEEVKYRHVHTSNTVQKFYICTIAFRYYLNSLAYELRQAKKKSSFEHAQNTHIWYEYKTGVYRGTYCFSYYCSKYRLWVLIRVASLRWF